MILIEHPISRSTSSTIHPASLHPLLSQACLWDVENRRDLLTHSLSRAVPNHQHNVGSRICHRVCFFLRMFYALSIQSLVDQVPLHRTTFGYIRRQLLSFPFV